MPEPMTDCPHGDSDPALCPPCQGAATPPPDITGIGWSGPFPARYNGWCVGCARPITAGDILRTVLDPDDRRCVQDGCETML